MKRHSTSLGQIVWWVLAGLLVLSLIGVAVGGARMLGYDPYGPSGPTAELIGHPAPELSLPLVSGAGAEEGDRVSLGNLDGKVVLLDFWASWCNPCRQSTPALNTVHRRYGERIEMYGVNVDTGRPRAAIAAAHRAFGADFPSLQDARGDALRSYRVGSIPTLVLIDRAGVVRWTHTGVPDPDDVAEHVDELLE